MMSWTLSLVVTVIGLAAGLAEALWWLLVVLEVAFAIAWGYLAFIDRTEVAST